MKTALVLLIAVILSNCKKTAPSLVEFEDSTALGNYSMKPNFEVFLKNKCTSRSIAKILAITFNLELNSLEAFDKLYISGEGNFGTSYYEYGNNDFLLIVGVNSQAPYKGEFYDQLVTSVEIVELKKSTYYRWDKVKNLFQKANN